MSQTEEKVVVTQLHHIPQDALPACASSIFRMKPMEWSGFRLDQISGLASELMNFTTEQGLRLLPPVRRRVPNMSASIGQAMRPNSHAIVGLKLSSNLGTTKPLHQSTYMPEVHQWCNDILEMLKRMCGGNLFFENIVTMEVEYVNRTSPILPRVCSAATRCHMFTLSVDELTQEPQVQGTHHGQFWLASHTLSTSAPASSGQHRSTANLGPLLGYELCDPTSGEIVLPAGSSIPGTYVKDHRCGQNMHFKQFAFVERSTHFNTQCIEEIIRQDKHQYCMLRVGHHMCTCCSRSCVITKTLRMYVCVCVY
jgi:hypothetical protein